MQVSVRRRHRSNLLKQNKLLETKLLSKRNIYSFVQFSLFARLTHTHTQTQTQTHRHRHTDTDTQTQTHRHRHTDTHTHRHRHTDTDTQTHTHFLIFLQKN